MSVQSPQIFDASTLAGLELHHVAAEQVTYSGRCERYTRIV